MMTHCPKPKLISCHERTWWFSNRMLLIRTHITGLIYDWPESHEDKPVNLSSHVHKTSLCFVRRTPCRNCVAMESGRWFYLVSAENDCTAKGGHLFHISNQREQDFILLFINSNQFAHACWMGLNDIISEETFDWISGWYLIFSY